MDMSAWAMYFSFDVMGEVGFGKDFNNLASGVEHSAIKGVHSHMTMLGIMSTVPWLLNVLSSIPGAAAGYSEFFGFCAGQIREKHKVSRHAGYLTHIARLRLTDLGRREDAPRHCVLVAQSHQGTGRVCFTKRRCPRRRCTRGHHRRKVSCQSTPICGHLLTHPSETTATTLASALFYLAACPEKQKKLQQLLDQAMPDGYAQYSYDKVKSVSYVDDFISETLRLRPALLTGGARETPSKGIQIGETYIPGNTNLVIPISLIQRDARYWPQAEDFVPERFGERRAEMGTDNAPYLPFSLGTCGYLMCLMLDMLTFCRRLWLSG